MGGGGLANKKSKYLWCLPKLNFALILNKTKKQSVATFFITV